MSSKSKFRGVKNQRASGALKGKLNPGHWRDQRRSKARSEALKIVSDNARKIKKQKNPRTQLRVLRKLSTKHDISIGRLTMALGAIPLPPERWVCRAPASVDPKPTRTIWRRVRRPNDGKMCLERVMPMRRRKSKLKGAEMRAWAK